MSEATKRVFVEALRRLARPAQATALGSAELAALGPQILERAFFSARNVIGDLITGQQEKIVQLVRGDLDLATARLEIKQLATRIGYQPDPAERGTIKDLSSDGRIELVLRHNTEEAQAYGQYLQGQEDGVIDAFPAQELFRLEGREKPRDWISIWRGEGGELFGGGRMIARKDDEIWLRLSDFGHPWPPFKFNSGMWVRDVSREEAIDLGVITLADRVQPRRRAFNDGLPLAA